jgi:SWI/SNF-related matrix-associated actin-dependent regulator 1 of chromatin subfamily A
MEIKPIINYQYLGETIQISLPSDCEKKIVTEIKLILKKSFKEYKEINEREIRLPMKYMNEITKLINEKKFKISIQEIPPKLFKIMENFKSIDPKDFSKFEIERLPKKITSSLFPFQKEGVNIGVQKEGKILIGDEMGLGKTIQANLYTSH